MDLLGAEIIRFFEWYGVQICGLVGPKRVSVLVPKAAAKDAVYHFRQLAR